MDQKNSNTSDSDHSPIDLSVREIALALRRYLVTELSSSSIAISPSARFYVDFDNNSFLASGEPLSHDTNIATLISAINIFEQGYPQVGPWERAHEKISDSPLLLIVDDEASVRALTISVLEDVVDCRFMEAGNGLEALALCRAHSPDLVLLDMMMPEMDGFATGQELQRLGIPFIANTSLSDMDSVKRIVEIGCISFIAKPSSFPQMRGAVLSALKQLGRMKSLARTARQNCEICTARGALSAYLSISPDQASEVIRELGRDNQGNSKDTALVVTNFLEFMSKAKEKYLAREARFQKKNKNK